MCWNDLHLGICSCGALRQLRLPCFGVMTDSSSGIRRTSDSPTFRGSRGFPGKRGCSRKFLRETRQTKGQWNIGSCMSTLLFNYVRYDMSLSLNSLRGGYIADYMGAFYGGHEGCVWIR